MSALAALLGASVCGVAALGVPELIARIPEPDEPEEPAAGQPGADEPVADESGGSPSASAPAEPKVPYAEIGRAPGLRLRVALVCAVAGAALGWSLGLAWDLLVLLPLVPVLVALSVVDWRTRLLPTWLVGRTYAGLVPLVLLVWALERDTGDLVRSALGWLVAGAFFFVLWFVNSGGLGYGDVRLSGVLGVALGHLGWGELLTGLWTAFLLGGVGGALLAAVGLADRKGVPFGPFMVAGALVGVLAGPWAWSHLARGGA